jgi:hypothetical protein
MNKTILALSLGSALAASTSFAAATTYSCKALGSDQVDDLTLTVAGNKVYGEVDGTKATGILNKDYSPRTGDEDYVEYAGLDALEGDEGVTELLVAKEMLKGADEGYVKLRARGEGYDNTKYECSAFKPE